MRPWLEAAAQWIMTMTMVVAVVFLGKACDNTTATVDWPQGESAAMCWWRDAAHTDLRCMSTRKAQASPGTRPWAE